MFEIKIINNFDRATDIVDENMTIGAIMEAHGINVNGRTIQVDGVTRAAGMTLAEAGGHDGSFLSTCVKADSAAKVTVLGNAIIVESAAKLEDLKKVLKYKPEALCVYEGEGNARKMVFKAVVNENSTGTVRNNFAEFGGRPTQEGNAVATMMFETDKDLLDFVETSMGQGLIYLKGLEEDLPAVLDTIEAYRDQVYGMVTLG